MCIENQNEHDYEKIIIIIIQIKKWKIGIDRVAKIEDREDI